MSTSKVPQPLKHFPPLGPPKRPYPLVRIRALCDGWPTGQAIARLVPDTEITLYLPPEGNVAWANAATDTRVRISDVKWMDDRILVGKVSVDVDAMMVGRATPFNLLINSNYVAPCGIVHFAERVAEWIDTTIQISPDKIHNYSLVFDHWGD